MPSAYWNGRLIAETDTFEEVEGNVYFPPDSIVREYFEPSGHHTTCGWKGVASYYHIIIDGERNADAAWYYRDPKDAASHIKGYVAFWKGVKVER